MAGKSSKSPWPLIRRLHEERLGSDGATATVRRSTKVRRAREDVPNHTAALDRLAEALMEPIGREARRRAAGAVRRIRC